MPPNSGIGSLFEHITGLDDATSVATFTNGTTPYAVVTGTADHCVTVVQLNQPNNISAGVSKCNEAGGQDTTLGPQLATPRDVEVWQNDNGTYAIIASQHDDAIQILDLSNRFHWLIQLIWLINLINQFN